VLKYINDTYNFSFPFKIINKQINSKIIIKVLKNNKQVTEITILEGMHKESLEQSFISFKKGEQNLPSVKFSKSMQTYFKKNMVPKRLESALLWPTKNNQVPKNSTIKIKVGRQDPLKENQIIKKILKTKGVRLRIDGNKLCTSGQMNKILKDIPHTTVEYIEDSFINRCEEINFTKNTAYKMAMDEDILSYFINKNWKDFPTHIKHVVIKLSLIGGVNELNYITRNLDRKNITYNLSSTFDGPLAIKFLYSLSKRKKYKKMKLPGLDTLRFMTKKKEP
jgi:O-succinylbenzoate synthase